MNGVNQVSGVLLPLIIFPYISRVLLPDGLGRVQFATSVAALFALVAALGIPVYGVRETARVRDNPEGLSRLTVELFSLNVIMTLLSVVAFVLFMMFSEKARQDPALFWIISVAVFTVPFALDWFFQGLEEFTWIALRSLFFRLLLLAGVFLFVRNTSDYRIYALLVSLNAAGAAVLNIGFAVRRIELKRIRWRELNWVRHMKPVLLMFALWAAVGIYTSVDKVMLGYLSNDAQVGFYTASDKIVRVVTGLVSALGMVLFPRLSYHLEKNETEEYGRLAGKFFRILGFFCLPAAFGLIAVAGPLILLFTGETFMPAVLPLRLMGLNVVMLSLSGFFGLQILYPQGREKLILRAILIGVAVNIGLNALLIPRMQAVGAAWATLIAETLVVLMEILFSRRSLYFSWPFGALVRYGLAALVTGIVAAWVTSWFASTWLQLFSAVFLGGLFYLICMLTLRDDVLLFLIGKGKSLFRTQLGRRLGLL